MTQYIDLRKEQKKFDTTSTFKEPIHLHTRVKFVYAVINFSSEFSNLIVLSWSILIKSSLHSISKGHIDKYLRFTLLKRLSSV